MASGETYTGNLTDSLDVVVASARIVREHEGVMPPLVDTQTLSEGTGLAWKEVSFAQLTAQNVAETERLSNPQTFTDTAFSITPTVVGIHTVLTDRVKARIDRKAYVKLGSLAQNAIQRKKDEDLLVVLDGATTSLCGQGTTLTTGHVDAAVVRITSNSTEPGNPPINVVLHGYQIRDIADEIKAGLGTYVIGEGMTARVFQEGIRGITINGARIYEDGNITIDSSSDAKGGVFAKEGIVLVQGRSPWHKEREEPDLGGGATSVWVYDEYAAGERSSGNWVYELYSDATAPSS